MSIDGDSTPSVPESGRSAGLGSVLRRGAVISAAGLVSVQITALIQTIVLARLLTPAEVGAFAAGTVLTTFVVVFSHSSLSHALIQRQGDPTDAAETVFWVTLGTGILLTVLLLCSAPLMSSIFHDPKVGAIVAATSGTAVLTSLMSVPDALMQREFRFERRIVVDPANAVSYAVVAITLAATGFGVWALVAGYYASLVVSVAVCWGLSGWRPLRGRFQFRLWREMAAFALPLLIESVVDRAVEVVETVVVGNRSSTPTLGNYRYGRRLAFMPVMAIVQVCSYVLFPAFARISDDAERFRSGFLRALGWMWLAVVPLTGLIAVVGEPTVVLVLGERWRGAGELVVAMSGVGIGYVLMSVCAEALKGAGRSHRINWMTGVATVTAIPLVLILVHFGLRGVGIALSVSAILTGLTGLVLTRTVVDVPVAELFRCLVPTTVAAAIATAVIALGEYGFVHVDHHGIAAGLGLVLVECIAFALLFAAALQILSPSTLTPVYGAARGALTRLRAA